MKTSYNNVYGLIIIGRDHKHSAMDVKSNFKKKFEMTSLGYFHYFLGLQVFQTKERIFLSISKYEK